MKKWILPISVGIMAVFTALIAVLASRQVFGTAGNDIFSNPAILWSLVILLAVFCVVQILCLFTYHFRFSKIGFYIFHAGLIAVLVGSFLYYLTGIKISGVFFVNPEGSSSDAQVQMVKSNRLRGDEYVADFNSFYLGVTDFTVDYYEPVYDVYRVFDNDKDPVRLMSDVEINSRGCYDFGKYGVRAENEMLDENGYAAVRLTSPDVVAVPRRSVKYYGGNVTIVNLADGRSVTEELIEVNKPLRVNGWKIYLMGYDEASDAASFLFKYDPAEYIELAGFWMLILGAFLMILIRPHGKGGDKA